jgi:tetratricopeptide (TPR) repeat protein
MGVYRLIAGCLGLLLLFGWPIVGQADPLQPADGDRCLLAVQQERYEQAIASCSQAIEQDNTNGADYRLSRGLAFYRSGYFADAIADNTQVLARHPDDYRAYYNRGLVHIALLDFDQALALNREDTRALFNHGCACHQLGRVNDALTDLNQVLILEPDHARTYLKRGVLRQALGDRTGSLADLHQAADCAQTQGQPHLHHYILTLLNEWQTPSTLLG